MLRQDQNRQKNYRPELKGFLEISRVIKCTLQYNIIYQTPEIHLREYATCRQFSSGQQFVRNLTPSGNRPPGISETVYSYFPKLTQWNCKTAITG